MEDYFDSEWTGEIIQRTKETLGRFLVPILKVLEATRVYRVPLLNCLILAVYAVCLVKLSLQFQNFYSTFALGTTALTNLLLLGLSDTLAQTLRNIAVWRVQNSLNGEAEPPFFSYILDHGLQRRIILDEVDDDLVELGLSGRSPSVEEIAEPPSFDFRRLALFSTWGVLNSFVQSPWYAFLNSAYNQDAKLVSVVQRVLADQLFYSPIMLAIFLSYLTITIERGDANDVRNTLATRYIPTLAVNMCIWPPAQFINFLIIPKSAQIPFSSSLGVLWNTYLSLNTS